jgi:menaquinol-cytochrome c reductase cytochrome b subunit
MRINKKILIESVLFSILLITVGIAWKVVQGFILTKAYTPDILNSYESIQFLESTTSFGVQSDSIWKNIFLALCGFISLTIIYYGIRIMIRKFRNKSE